MLGNNEAERELASAGPPPYGKPGKTDSALPMWANVLDPGQIRLPLTSALPWEIIRNARDLRDAGWVFSQRTLRTALTQTDLPALGYRFEVEGNRDIMVEGRQTGVDLTPPPTGKP